MRLRVVGAGAVGARVARSLLADPSVAEVAIEETDERRCSEVLEALADDRATRTQAGDRRSDDVVVLAQPVGDHVERAQEALAGGAHVVSVSDDVGEVRALLALHQVARSAERTLVAGAGFSPGLACLLAVHAARELEVVDEVHVARVGVGGPACDRQQQRALHALSIDWRDGEWIERPGGAGREQCWFPDPIGGVDCFRAARPEAMLLVPLFPDVQRVTARLGTDLRNPLQARLVGRRKVAADGPPGAIRVEVRGRGPSGAQTVVLGCMDRSSVAASAVAATVARTIGAGAGRRVGAGGVAEVVEVLPTLHLLAEAGVRAARFEGSMP